jgi:5-formyltetrahydrofolate cyclo-ligase
MTSLMTIPDPLPPKAGLRKRMRQLLRDRVEGGSDAFPELEAWLSARPELRTIAVYSPLPGEVDLSKSIAALPQTRWVYPRVLGEHLTFHSGENLIPGSFGILEPREGTGEVPVFEIDAFICPGLAFDSRGGRLGRGRGFYDRVLANARPDSLNIGVCHNFQMVDDTFSEPHDVFMDQVFTYPAPGAGC